MAEKTSELELINAETDESEAIARIKTNDDSRLQETTDDIRFDENTDDESEDTPDEAYQIREQIVETRREMSETIDAIQEKLSFSNISEQVQTQVSEQINNAVETAKDALFGKTADVVNSFSRGFKDIGNADLVKKAQQNPTALALIGAGIGALLVGVLTRSGKRKKKKGASYNYDYNYEQNVDSDEVHYANTSRRDLNSARTEEVISSQRRSRADETAASTNSGSTLETISSAANTAVAGVSSAASSAYQTVSDAAGKTYDGASGVAGKTYEGIGSVAGKTYDGLGSAAGYTYEKAGDLGGQMKVNYNYYIEENPLAVGAVALAIGAAIGFAIPLTSKENEYLGDYRDQVLDKAQATAQDALGTVKQMTTEVQKVITDEVKSKTA